MKEHCTHVLAADPADVQVVDERELRAQLTREHKPERRVCCHCGAEQRKHFTPDPYHGPFLPITRYVWEPPLMGSECPGSPPDRGARDGS